ncbi:hypothetical protein QQP08_024363 [Theobroma cacao]|nr:hypothetical protein QQP08_024363 [Theobroma cacao]
MGRSHHLIKTICQCLQMRHHQDSQTLVRASFGGRGVVTNHLLYSKVTFQMGILMMLHQQTYWLFLTFLFQIKEEIPSLIKVKVLLKVVKQVIISKLAGLGWKSDQ